MEELTNYCVDESNSKVDHSKNDEKCRHDEISKIKAHFYLFRSLALKVILKKENDKSLITNVQGVFLTALPLL